RMLVDAPPGPGPAQAVARSAPVPPRCRDGAGELGAGGGARLGAPARQAPSRQPSLSRIGCDDWLMPTHWLKAVGHARGPLPGRWIEEGRTSALREGGFPRRPRVDVD